MKALPKILFAVTAVAALSFAYPAKANLITNGGFETGDFTGWTRSMFFVDGTFNGQAPHSGNFQAVKNLGPSASLSQSVATTPGAAYTVSFFAAANNGPIPPDVTMTVTFGATTIFSHLFDSNTGYTGYTVNVTASSASSALNFNLDGEGLGFVLLDDISVALARVGVPDGGSTVSLLGCALLGLAALRRKLSC